MPTIKFIEQNGQQIEVDVAEGTSAMLGARQNSIAGVDAECGGSLSCGTCHVYVDDSFLSRISPASEAEEEMLNWVAAERRPNSRLSCQIVMRAELDGLILYVPNRQT